jgi:hypothetical protein
VVSWIEAFTPAQLMAAIASANAAYARNVGPVTPTVATQIALGVQALADSYNVTPPLIFTPAGFASWDASQEHRGWTKLDPTIECCDGRVQRGASNLSDDAGWTPVDIPENIWGLEGRFYSRAESGGSGVSTRGVWEPDTHLRGKCRTFTANGAARIAPLENVLQSLLTGQLAPFISREIEYTICCDGTVEIQFSGSYFPSHRAYVGQGGWVTSVGVSPQSPAMLGTFMWSTGVIPPTPFACYSGNAVDVTPPASGAR